MNNHTPTPTPWAEADGDIYKANQWGEYSVGNDTEPLIARLGNRANAAFIVRAVNAYERDQEIIRAFADYDCEQPDGIGCERFDEKYGTGSPTCWPCKARQAVDKAEGK